MTGGFLSVTIRGLCMRPFRICEKAERPDHQQRPGRENIGYAFRYTQYLFHSIYVPLHGVDVAHPELGLLAPA